VFLLRSPVLYSHHAPRCDSPSDMRVPPNPADRGERHDVESLKRQHGGDVKMRDLLAALVAECPKTRSFSIYNRCKAVYDKASRQGGR
jgi:hypothetical protein